jgi:hypothetical protein
MRPKNVPALTRSLACCLSAEAVSLDDRGSGRERVGAPIDQREHVLRVFGLHIAVAAGAYDMPARGAHQRGQPADEEPIVHERRHRRLHARLRWIVSMIATVVVA